MRSLSIPFLTCILVLLVQVSLGQAPQISYGDYRFLTMDSVIVPFSAVNKGGAVPHVAYGQTTTVAGAGDPSNRNGGAFKAGFNHPSGIAWGSNGTLFIADEKNNSIRKITADGTVTTIATGFNGPSAIAADVAGNLYVADCYNHRIRKISFSGVVSTLAGNGKPGDANSPNALSAQFRYPVGIATDLEGNVYVSDEGNNKIRKISAKGAVTTFAGRGRPGDKDDENGQLAGFNQPAGLAVDRQGNVYVADQLNHKIRKISPTGSVSTIAGTGFAGSANHVEPALASFNNPKALTVSSTGWIYVCDTGNQLIRRIDPNGQVSTLAGSGASGSTDNRDGTLASFFFPAAIIENGSSLFLADCLSNKIRKIEINGYEVSPVNFPQGVTFDYTSGTISGRPTAFSPGQSYRITAYNTEGSSETRLTLAVSSQPGNALNFDGVDDMVVVQNDPMLTPPVVTVEMWVKVGYGKANHRFILKRNTLPHFDESYSLGIGPEGYFEILMSSGTGLPGSQIRKRNNIIPIPNKWYFIGGVFSETNLKMYVDGELAVEAATGFPISQSDNGLFLNFDERSKMTVDEVRLFNYDRSDHIRQDMIQPLSPGEPGLIAYYDFNMGIAAGKNSYTTLFDKTGHGYNGEIQQFYPAPGLISNWVQSYAMVVPISDTASHISNHGFTANWAAPLLGKADHYLLDVASDREFQHILSGYNGKKVESISHQVDGLAPATTYYFRVRAYRSESDEQGGYSQIIQLTTNP